MSFPTSSLSFISRRDQHPFFTRQPPLDLYLQCVFFLVLYRARIVSIRFANKSFLILLMKIALASDVMKSVLFG